MKLIKLIMPSQGDMEIVKQDGGVITLKPIYFGGECAGPIIQFVDFPELGVVVNKDADVDVSPKVEASYRIKIRDDGKIQLLKGQV